MMDACWQQRLLLCLLWLLAPLLWLQDAPAGRFDVVVLSMGANDATGLCTPVQWARWQARLADMIDQRFAPALLVHSAVPPMHTLTATWSGPMD